MKIGELTNLYIEAKEKLEAQRGPPKKQKAIEGIPLMDELVRDGAIIAFMMGVIFLMIAVAGPPLHAAYDMTKPPTFVKPDWYLLWSLGPIFLAKWPIGNPLPWGPDPLVDTKFLGTILVNVAFVVLMVIPFFAGRGKTKRPVEDATPAAWGVFGLAFIWWMSMVGIADVIYAYEVQPLKGVFHWLSESGVTPSPSELINWLGIITLWQSLAVTWLAYWFLTRHKPRYESKLNATYYKVR